MGVEVIDSSLDSGFIPVDELFTGDSDKLNLDARRKLEDKLEEMRLQRELREFDFDI